MALRNVAFHTVKCSPNIWLVKSTEQTLCCIEVLASIPQVNSHIGRRHDEQ